MKRWIPLLALLMPALALADTTWVAPGDVSGEWIAEHSPYLVTGSITVQHGDSLRIWDGVDVRFTMLVPFNVYGYLEAIGTEARPVTIGYDSLQNAQGWDGIYVNSPDSVAIRLYDCTVFQARNGDNAQGPAVHLYSSQAELYDCRIRPRFQGLLLVRSSADLTDCDFTGDPATQYSQGIRAWDDCRLNLTRCYFGGLRITDGPALMLSRTRLTVTDCVFAGNDGGVWGGAIFADDSCQLAFSGTVFSENEAALGGAICAFSSGNHPTTLVADHCVFYRNGSTQTATGGAIYSASAMTLANCTFVANRANDGCAFRAASGPTVTSCIFYDHDQGPLFSSTLPSVLRHSLFHENANTNELPGWPQFGDLDRTNANGDSCDMFYNIFLDPLLADTAAGDFQLTAESPCIDAGDSLLPRDPDGSLADVGAYVFENLPSPLPLATPHSPQLLFAYPNPFNARVSIEFALSTPQRIVLTAFDLTGRAVARLAEGFHASGVHRVTLDGASLAAGVYFVSLRSGSTLTVRKLLLLK